MKSKIPNPIKGIRNPECGTRNLIKEIGIQDRFENTFREIHDINEMLPTPHTSRTVAMYLGEGFLLQYQKWVDFHLLYWSQLLGR